MSTPAGLASFKRSMITKFAGKCCVCEAPTKPGIDYAAVNANGQWAAYCARCASSVAAQVAGLLPLVEAAAEGLDADKLATVQSHLPDEADVVRALSGEAEGLAMDVRVKLMAAREVARLAHGVVAQEAVQARTNKYGGKCGKCGAWVAEGAGRIEKPQGSPKWVTFHLDGQCSTTPATPAAPTVEADEGLYVHDDGMVRRVYMTRNERLGCKVLVVEGDHGSLQYEKGGVRIVQDAIAAGTVHKCSQDEAAAFGRLHGFCMNCGLDLDDDRSLAAGYGPYCADNHGWWYPTYTEAAAVLGRPCGPKAKV
jgi:hypothetical protein